MLRNNAHYCLGILILLLVVFGCSPENNLPQSGPWTGYMQMMDGEKMPMRFRVSVDNMSWRMDFYNADETFSSKMAYTSGDSVQVDLPYFEASFVLISKQDSMWGKYYIPDLDRELDFWAYPGKWEPGGKEPAADLSGRWETEFTKRDQSTYPALTILEQQGNSLRGTVRTTTGDYRYLEGKIEGSDFWLSTFDGAHQYLLKGTHDRDSLWGKFYLGNHEVRSFVSARNSDFRLASADSLSYLLPGYEKLEFQFKDLQGIERSLEDAEFKDKAVVIQLMGSWCPNCLEESKFIKEYRKAHPETEVAFVALAFEYAKTEERALAVLRRHKDRLGMDYPVLLAQYGGVNKEDARQKLPMLSSVWSYPTMLFLDKNHKPIRIHSGFNGAATQEVYDAFKAEFHESLLQLQEKSK